MKILRLFCCLCGLLTIASNVFAQSARLQDERVYLGDIAVLLIEYDNQIPSLYALDTTALASDFEVLDIQSRTSRLSDSGQFTNRMQWEIKLLPRRSGRLRIPPLKLGELLTPEVELEVVPLAGSIETRQTVVVEMLADPSSPLIGQQTNVTMRVLYSTPLRDVYWLEPSADGTKIMRGIAASGYRLQRDGQDFQVAERTMALFPQVQGEVVIGPAGLRAVIDAEAPEDATAAPTTRRWIQRNSSPLRLRVRDIPNQYGGKYWLPARALELTQRWDIEPGEIRVGDSVGRVITLIARGLPAGALPADLLAGGTDAYGVYSDQPSREQWVDGTDLVGRLEQTFALIMTASGDVRVPDFSLKWWDVDAGLEREILLPGRKLRVLAALPRADDDALNDLWAGSARGLLARALASPERMFGAMAAFILAWLAWRKWGVQLRRWLSRRRQLARARRRLRLACRDNDPRRARAALLQWAALRWPGERMTGLARVADRFGQDALHAEISRLDHALYASAAPTWDGQRLWHQLRSSRSRVQGTGELLPPGLPPLYPGAAN